MGWLLFALLIGVPLIEIVLFVEIGGAIGTWPTIGLVVLTAIVGSIMLRAQGSRVLQRAQEKINRGEPPVADLLDGVGLLLAGALLLTPGFFTDAVGFAMLVPALRAALAAWLWAQMRARGHRRAGAHGRAGGGGDSVIDGEYSHVDPAKPTDPKSRDGSPWIPKR